MGGAASGLGAAGSLTSLGFQERGRKGLKKAGDEAIRGFGTTPGFQGGAQGFRTLLDREAPLFQNLDALLSGNSLDELRPALRSIGSSTIQNQRSFADRLGRSGLTGSGLDLGGNFAIQQAGDVAQADVLSQLPALQRANLSTALPFLQTAIGERLGVAGGRSQAIQTFAPIESAAKSQQGSTLGNAIAGQGPSGGGKGGGAPSGFMGALGGGGGGGK